MPDITVLRNISNSINFKGIYILRLTGYQVNLVMLHIHAQSFVRQAVEYSNANFLW